MKSLRSFLVTLAVMVFLFMAALLATLKSAGAELKLWMRYQIYTMGEILYARMVDFNSRTGAMLYAVSLPNGALVHLAASYGAWTNMTAVSNANPAVATLAAGHTIIVNDVMEVESGWSRLNGKVVRASAVNVNDVTLESIDTTSTSIYAAGSGTGRVREIASWTQLLQILNSSSQGGEQQFLEYQFLEADGQRRIPTTKSAAGLTFSVADDPTLAGYELVKTANDDRLQRAVRVTLPSGAKLFYNAYVSVSQVPTLTVNEISAVEVTLSFLNEPVRYTT